MSNDPTSPLTSSYASLSEADYDALCAALSETARGRRFLAEYLRRNHPTDTQSALAAIQRMEQTISGERAAQSFDRFRFDVVEMAEAIARTKAEIAAIKPDVERYGQIEAATEELDSIVHMTETATSRILAAAEQIQEISWALREQGVDNNFCDQLDAQTTEIFTACSFQDLTGQRTRKVIQVLSYLEDRINAMIAIWGDQIPQPTTAKAEKAPEDPLINGPSPPGGLEQADVDIMMEPPDRQVEDRRDASIEDIGRSMLALEPIGAAVPDASVSALKPAEEADPADFLLEPAANGNSSEKQAPPATEATSIAQLVRLLPATSLESAAGAEPTCGDAEILARPFPVSPPKPVSKPAMAVQNDLLAPLRALSDEEKIALFS
ncbi:MAG: hypothetical protein QOJ96_3803 [Alphaproteobacteria bacterium]|jgi:hypothetical protein|nr:hypothetical protein [Alphaproteobacteria bacterium]